MPIVEIILVVIGILTLATICTLLTWALRQLEVAIVGLIAGVRDLICSMISAFWNAMIIIRKTWEEGRDRFRKSKRK